MTASRTLHIASRPSTDHDNPYFSLLYRALSQHGIEHRGLFQLNDDWLRHNAAEIDAIHVHWPEYLWRVDGRTTLRHIGGVVRFLRLARSLGIQRVWTVHNLPPHEPSLADFTGLWMLSREIDLFVCHSEDVLGRLNRWRMPPRSSDVVIMRMGNYDGVYPPPTATEGIARGLGIPEGKIVVTMLGRLRPYKGLETAFNAATLLPSSMHVVIAGRPFGDIGALRRAASAARERITLIDRDLTNQEVSDLLQLTEVVWLPYHRISTSAALLLALTAGRGVVATDLPFFREILSRADDAGRLVAGGDPVALAASTVDYLMVPRERRCRAARGLADEFEWPSVVADFATVLRRRVEQTRH